MPILSNANHERYSRLRAILIPPRAAAKSIGLNPKSGVATKLERNDKIRARIAELVAEEETIIRENPLLPGRRRLIASKTRFSRTR